MLIASLRLVTLFQVWVVMHWELNQQKEFVIYVVVMFVAAAQRDFGVEYIRGKGFATLVWRIWDMSDNSEVLDRYALGLVFSTSEKEIALIQKEHPDFLSGSLNGIGGRMNETAGETPLETMSRTFTKETGAPLSDFTCEPTCVLTGLASKDKKGWVVYCYKITGDLSKLAGQPGQEDLDFYELDELMEEAKKGDVKIGRHLEWLIPFHLAAIEYPVMPKQFIFIEKLGE